MADVAAEVVVMLGRLVVDHSLKHGGLLVAPKRGSGN